MTIAVDTSIRPSIQLMVAAAAALSVMSCGMQSRPLAPPEVAPIVDDTDPARARVDIVKNTSMPFVVDWNPENRGDLEIAARHGPAIVHFDQSKLELLPDCHAAGSYVYAGFTPKGEFKTLRSRAELHANLPVSAAALEARLKSNGSLSIAIRMVGKHELDVAELGQAQLTGRGCEAATHYVRRLTLGAFRFITGESRSAAAAAGVPGLGAGADADASTELLQFDGDFKACDQANVDAEAPPAGCRAVLRIELVPIGGTGAAAAPANGIPECGQGLRWDGEACVSLRRLEIDAERARSSSGTAQDVRTGGFECQPDNAQECVAQCKAGNMPSCTNLGVLLLVGTPDLPKDESRAIQLWKVACVSNEMEACASLGRYHSERQEYREALLYGGKACVGGDAGACTDVGVASFFGHGTKENRAVAFKLWVRACKLGQFVGCNNAGVMVLWGIAGVGKDQVAARKLFERACASPGREGCGNLASCWELGLGGPQDLRKALELGIEDCSRSAYSCAQAGMLLEEGAPDSSDAKTKALELYERGCAMPPGGGCLSTEEIKSYLPGVYSEDGADRRACEDAPQSALACYNAGIAYERGYSGRVDLEKAQQFLKKSCDQGLKKACRDARPKAATVKM